MANRQPSRDLGKLGKVLLTGHTGFKGTWATLLLQELGLEVVGLSLPAEPGSLYERLNRRGAIEEHFFDIADRQSLADLLENSDIQTVIHMAAQPLVLFSYKNPAKTFETNVLGTVNVLDACFSSASVKTVVVVTTDKVYENKNIGKRFVETDSLAGKDPYSASKVGAEAAVAAWTQISKISGGPTVISARAGNVIGGGDFAQDRIIPDIVRGFLDQKPVEIRNPKSTRPWQHALDPISGYLIAAIDATLNKKPYAVNFGPRDQSMEVQEVVKVASQVFKNRLNVLYPKIIQNNLEAELLDLDSGFAEEYLGWKPVWTQQESITRTFEWWVKVEERPEKISDICKGDIRAFISAHGFFKS
jgi:CDP-glucose 4,6-dehydratase